MTNNKLIYYFKTLVNTPPLLVIKGTKSKHTLLRSKATTSFHNHREVLETEVINPN